MPTVPTTFVPQVSPSGGGDIGQFAAPGVVPVENLAARQQEAFGRATTQAGLVAFRAASALRDDLDEAGTKQGDVAFLTGATEVESKYRSMVGQDAEKGYEAAVGQLGQLASSALDGLENDTQRKMLTPVLSRNLAAIRSRMTEHRNKQVSDYLYNESLARRDIYVDSAINAHSRSDREGRIQFETDLGVALVEARKAASIRGIPEGSAQMKMVEREVHDRVATGVVAQMMSARKYSDADEFVTTNGKSLDPNVADRLKSSIEANRERTVVEELTASIMDRGRLESISDPKAYPVDEGADGKPVDDLRDALERAESIKDPMTRKSVQSNLRTSYAQRDALVAAEYNRNLESVADHIASGKGWQTVDPMSWGMVKPGDRAKLMRQQAETNNDYTMMRISDDPRLLTDQYLNERYLAGDITPATYVKLKSDLRKPDAQQRIFEATIDADMLNVALFNNGMADLVSPKQGDKESIERKARLQDTIKGRIESEQNKPGGRKMSDKEKQGIIDRAIIEMGTSVQEDAGWLWFDKTETLPIAMMTPKQKAGVTGRYLQIGDVKIPQNEYESIYADLASAGRGMTPTAKQVLEYYMRTKGQQ